MISLLLLADRFNSLAELARGSDCLLLAVWVDIVNHVGHLGFAWVIYPIRLLMVVYEDDVSHIDLVVETETVATHHDDQLHDVFQRNPSWR